jgi:hypothetical protein
MAFFKAQNPIPMKKPVLLTIIVLSLALVGYNVTLVDFENPLEGDSLIALIGVLAALCALVLILIYHTSRKIQKRLDDE